MPSVLQLALVSFGLLHTTIARPASSWYQASVGIPWQVVLESDIGDLNLPVDVYDIDLFTTPQSTIDQLHSNGKQVLCYFSAGTYEPNRPDSAELLADSADLGNTLSGWPDERWLNIRSDKIVSIMKARIDTAVSKKCDGLDPDNVDGYSNDNAGGFTPGLSQSDSVAFLQTLSTYAHSVGLGIGLKNAGDIVQDTSSFLDWVVNEQCVQYGECATFRPFINAGKPVFHIEYKNQSPNITDDCHGANTASFSTVIKPDESSIPKDLIPCT
ncbi:hypothetical protein G7Y89_g13573 [Cudoniella acicularis]|uniref:alpha-galactosidase n=1 Tax=Cudoniella acicularis TaxID=354080 RepID=A0A8H4R9A8_9HELO|nr:hypothetical protein G7Y89_g13573 [Cudoniella acicularis]